MLTLDVSQTKPHLHEMRRESQVVGQFFVLEEQELEPFKSEVIITLHLVAPSVDHIISLGVEAILKLARDLCMRKVSTSNAKGATPW